MARLLALALCLLLVVVGAHAGWGSGLGELGRSRKRRDKAPWFCHGRDCPRFKLIKEHGPFAVRRYERSTWAAVCVRDEMYEAAVWKATAHLMNYIRGCNKKGKALWGGTPFARIVKMEPAHLEAWNATASNQTALECAHKAVCVAYYLPDKYQHGKRPPRPDSDWIMVVRVPRWTAYVAQFDGFPTRLRFIFNYLRLVHVLKWHRLPFDWRMAVGFVYDPPFATRRRHNEVLVPERHMDELLFGEGAQNLFPDRPLRGIPAATPAETSAELAPAELEALVEEGGDSGWEEAEGAPNGF